MVLPVYAPLCMGLLHQGFLNPLLPDLCLPPSIEATVDCTVATVFSFGRSRHGAPVRSTHKIPLMIVRWSEAGTLFSVSTEGVEVYIFPKK